MKFKKGEIKVDYQNNGQNDNRTVENNTNDYVIRDQGKFDSDTTLFIVLGVVEAVVCSMLCGALAAVFALLVTTKSASIDHKDLSSVPSSNN